jgi:hypothetical protein
MTHWLKRLPDFQKSAPGLEWALWKRMPRILGWGTALPVLVAVLWHLLSPDNPSPDQERNLLLFDYVVAGVVVLHWTLVLTVAIGCIIVMLMKGPAYVADAYPLNDSDHPR